MCDAAIIHQYSSQNSGSGLSKRSNGCLQPPSLHRASNTILPSGVSAVKEGIHSLPTNRRIDLFIRNSKWILEAFSRDYSHRNCLLTLNLYLRNKDTIFFLYHVKDPSDGGLGGERAWKCPSPAIWLIHSLILWAQEFKWENGKHFFSILQAIGLALSQVTKSIKVNCIMFVSAPQKMAQWSGILLLFVLQVRPYCVFGQT